MLNYKNNFKFIIPIKILGPIGAFYQIRRRNGSNSNPKHCRPALDDRPLFS